MRPCCPQSSVSHGKLGPIKFAMIFSNSFVKSEQISILSIGGYKPPWPPPSPCKQSGKCGARFATRARQFLAPLEHFTQQVSGKMRMIAVVKMRHSAGPCPSAAATQRKD